LLLDKALEYAERGWKVFPIKAGTKVPATQNGFKDATSDTSIVAAYFQTKPNNTPNIAVATGSDSGFFVIDVDPRNGGSVPDGLPETLTAITGGGGLHYYFRYPTETYTIEVHERDTDKGYQWRRCLSEGVDVKADGGYVLVPPSKTISEYRYIDETVPIADAPDWLLEASQKPYNENLRVEYADTSYDTTDTRPGSIFNRTATWPEILEPHGWVQVYQDGDEVFWRRPGKSEGISASTGYAGLDILYVFTSSTELEASCGYSKFAAHSYLDYGGSFRDCAKSLDTSVTIDTANLVSAYNAESRVDGTSILVKKEDYHFEPAFPPDHFVSKFIEFVSLQTDAALEYSEACGLGVLATVGYKCRATLAPYPGGLSPNLYTILVGGTTRSRKSTVQRIGAELVNSVIPSATLPSKATPEAFVKALADRNGISALWTPDEFGISLSEMYNRDFMTGLEALLLTIYAGDDYVYQRSMDSIVVRQPSLNITGAATPESLGRSGPNAVETGLLPRFGIVFPKTLPEARPVDMASPDLAVKRAELVTILQQIHTWSHSNNDIVFGAASLKSLNDTEGRLLASGQQYVRLPTMLYKLGLLSAIGRREVSVNQGDVLAASRVVERWKQGVDNLLPLLYKSTSDPLFDRQLEFALSVLDNHGGKAPRTIIADALAVRKSRLNEIEDTLLDRGKIRLDMKDGGKLWIRL
jgi:hypothetical protein